MGLRGLGFKVPSCRLGFKVLGLKVPSGCLAERCFAGKDLSACVVILLQALFKSSRF